MFAQEQVVDTVTQHDVQVIHGLFWIILGGWLTYLMALLFIRSQILRLARGLDEAEELIDDVAADLREIKAAQLNFERTVFDVRDGDMLSNHKTFAEIAKTLDVTQDQILQIRDKLGMPNASPCKSACCKKGGAGPDSGCKKGMGCKQASGMHADEAAAQDA